MKSRTLPSLLKIILFAVVGIASARAELPVPSMQITSSPSPSWVGQPVTFTATVGTSSDGRTPTGSVTFSYLGGEILTATLDGTGQASVMFSNLPMGGVTIVAEYSGDEGWAPASTSMMQEVMFMDMTPPPDMNPPEPPSLSYSTTTAMVSPSPLAPGQMATVTAVVAAEPPAIGTPTGTVTFSGPGMIDTVAPLVDGVAVITADQLSTGTIVATYNGDGSFYGSVGTVSVTIESVVSTTTVTATPNPSVHGESVTVMATVSGGSSSTSTPTGTVTFTGPEGFNLVSVLVNGAATVTTSALSTGTISATYGGDETFGASSGSAEVTVNQGATTTELTTTPGPLVYGQTVTVVATVDAVAPASGMPTGTVTFTGPGGLSQVAVLTSEGKAEITTSSLSTGTLTATYGGDAGFEGSSSTAVVTVNPGSSITTVNATPNPSVFGESVTVVATVVAVAPASATPTGTVTFTGAGGFSQTIPLGSSGTAEFTTSVLATGAITATYNGDAMLDGSVGTSTVIVNQGATLTTVTATPDVSVHGQTVTVTATVAAAAPAVGIATGTVTFTGPGQLNQTVALNSMGVAALTTNSLVSGTITATYHGDDGFASSTASTSVTVNSAETTTTVVATPAPSVHGQSVEISAVITANAPASGIPTGTVTFTGPGGFQQAVALDVSGIATTTTAGLATGTITATYSGDEGYNASTGSTDVTVNPGSSLVTLVTSTTSAVYGDNVTLTAAVAAIAPAAGTATGSVKFMDGATVLETVALVDGVATYASSALGGGSHSLTAVYDGDTAFTAATSDAVVLTVASADQTITFAAIANLKIGESTELSATASSGLPVSFSVVSGLATISGHTLTATGVGSVTVQAAQPGDADYSAAAKVERSFSVTMSNPAVTTPAQSPTPSKGGSAELKVTDANPNVAYQWQRNGADISGAANSSLTLSDVQPMNAGLYTYKASVGGSSSATSEPVIVGVASGEKVVGSGEQVGADIHHPNGNTYDQVLLEGTGATVTADAAKVTRVSFVDLTNDIVQVEFSGAGTLSVVMDDASVPAPAANYNQAGVDYVKGHVGLVVTGADETSNISVISVGPITAVNQTLFKDGVDYDGVADIAFVAIQSTNGKFGGVRTGNAHYFASSGFTGLYAPEVEFTGPVNIGDVTAFDAATPVLVTGAAETVQITGGSLAQENGQSIKTSGITQMKFVDGMTSQGARLPAQADEGLLEEEGINVTDMLVVNPQ